MAGPVADLIDARGGLPPEDLRRAYGTSAAVGTVTAAPVSFPARVGAAFKAFSAAIFSPNVPMQPAQETQDEGARAWQYVSGYNLNLVPRASEGLTPFQWMLNITDLYDTLQMGILYRQEQMAALDFDIIPRDERRPPSQAQLSEAKERIEQPDGRGGPGRHRFAQWLTAYLWDVLVTDAASVFLDRSLTGEVLAWKLVSGATIKPLIDGSGNLPGDGLPAYQQILYGKVFWEGSTDDLIYAPKNPRPNSAYGRSPVEMLILNINRALRRQGHDIHYFSDGNVPDALVSAPPEWSPDQLDKMQLWFDTVVRDPKNRRKLHFIPNRGGKLGVYEFKPPILDTVVEEFLDRRTLAMLGVPPNELGMTVDVNRSTGQTQENVGQRRHLPYLRFTSGLVTDLFYESGLPDCMLQFAAERPEEDKLAQAQVDEAYVRLGIRSPEGIAADRGFRDDKGQKYVYLVTGAVPFTPASGEQAALTPPSQSAAPGAENRDVTTENAPPSEASPQDVAVERVGGGALAPYTELQQWRRFALRKAGGRPFQPRTLSPDLATAIQRLLDAPVPDEDRPAYVRTLFSEARGMLDESRVPAGVR